MIRHTTAPTPSMIERANQLTLRLLTDAVVHAAGEACAILEGNRPGLGIWSAKLMLRKALDDLRAGSAVAADTVPASSAE